MIATASRRATTRCTAQMPTAAAAPLLLVTALLPWAATTARAEVDGAIFLEAENFSSSSCWEPRPWGDNYYAATFHNVFLSRKAFLRAPGAGGVTAPCVASIQTNISTAGIYTPMVRFEAPYRFEAMFHLRVEQAGSVVFEGLYGGRDQGKV